MLPSDLSRKPYNLAFRKSDSMEGLLIFFTNLVQVVSIVGACLLTAYLIEGKRDLTYKSAFVYLFIGILSFATVFAVFATSGKTVMLGYIIILLGFAMARRKDRRALLVERKQKIPVILGLSLIHI